MKPSLLIKYLILATLIPLLTTCRRVIDIPLEPRSNELYTGAVLVDPAEYEQIPLIQSPLVGARVSDKNVLPSDYLIPYMPWVGFQGYGLGSCTGWAVGYAARSALYQKSAQLSYRDATGNLNWDAVFSAGYVWNSLNGGQNVGVNIPSAMELIQREGVATWRVMKRVPDYDFTMAPTPEQRQAAMPYKIKAWGRIKIDPTTIKQFVFSDIPVVITITTDANFRHPTVRTTQNEFLWTKFDPGTYDKTALHGSHAVVIMGYSNTLNAFKVQNSWGTTQWVGKDGRAGTGFIWMDYGLLTTVVQEAYVMLTNDGDKEKPVIETQAATGISSSTATLNGIVRTFGNTPIQQYGFLAATDSTLLQFLYAPQTDTYSVSPGVSLLNISQALRPPQSFSATDQISSPAKRYFRAFGRSYNGVYYGQILNYVPLPTKIPDPVENNIQRTPTAVSTSDPHMKTFDQGAYDFMAAGEFVAVKSGTDRFEMQVRQQELKNVNSSGLVSFNTGLALHTGSDAVCIFPDGRVFVNQSRISLGGGSYALRNGWAIQQTDNRLTVLNSSGDQIEVRLFGTNLDYYTTLAPSRKGKLRGLLGNFDGNVANDLVRGDNGQAVPNTFAALYPAFADSWRIKQTESLFVYDAGTTTETYTDRAFPRQAINLTAQQRASAEAECKRQGITDPVALQNCIVDLALTGDNSLAQRSLDFQTAGNVLNSFSIGRFLTTDVQLEYTSATAENNAAVLNTASRGFSRVVMRQGVNIGNGFVSEFSFTADEFNPISCFYLALWPTTPDTRSLSQKRAGFCFGINNDMATTFFTVDEAYVPGLPAQAAISLFNDKRIHRVRLSETRLANGQFRVQIFYDNLNAPVVSIDNSESIAQIIDAEQNTGYIEFQINRGAPTKVNVYNWTFQSR